MTYIIYDCYEGEDIYLGVAFDQKQAERMMNDRFNETDGEANIYAKREDGKVFVLGYKGILEEVKQ